MLGHDPLSARPLSDADQGTPGPVYAGAINRNVGPGMPFQARLGAIPVVVSGGDVNLALTGQGVTVSSGTLTPSTTVAIAGQALTVSAGTLTPSLSVALTGSAVTTATGTLTPSSSVALSGQAVTTDTGTLAPSTTVSLSGIDVSASTGTLVASGFDVPAPIGYINRNVGPAMPMQAMLRAGPSQFVSPDVTVTLNGTVVSVGTGALEAIKNEAFGQNLRNGMFGPALDFAPSPRSKVGTGTSSPDVTVSLTGTVVSTAAGSLTPSTTITLSGQEVSVSAGTITASINSDVTIALTGTAVTVSAGTLTPSLSVGVSGQVASVSSGLLAPTTSVAVGGQAATYALGTLTVSADLALGGQGVTVDTGTITASGTGDVTVALTGASASFATGNLIASGGDVYNPSTNVQQGSGGGGGGFGKKRRTAPDTWDQRHPLQALDRLIDTAVAKQVYGDIQASTAPAEVKAEAKAVVKPTSAPIDWQAVQNDADKVAKLVSIWQEHDRKRRILAADDEWMMLGD